MKRDGGFKRPGFKLVLIVLLAVLCIGAAELAACSHFAPETYERITAPARQAAAAVADAGRAGLDAVGRFCRDTAALAGRAVQNAARQVAAFWEELTAPPPPPLEPEPELSPPPEDSLPFPRPPSRPSPRCWRRTGSSCSPGGPSPLLISASRTKPGPNSPMAPIPSALMAAAPRPWPWPWPA